MKRLLSLLTLALLTKGAAAGPAVIWSSPYPLVLKPGIMFQGTDNTTTCDTLATGAIRYNAGTFEGCDGSAWFALGATGGPGTVTSVGLSVPSFLSVSGSPVTSSGVLAVSLSGTALPIANGGTGQTSATNAINALLPAQTGNSGKFLTTNGSAASWATSGGILANNTYLQGYDSTAAARNLIGIDTFDNVNVGGSDVAQANLTGGSSFIGVLTGTVILSAEDAGATIELSTETVHLPRIASATPPVLSFDAGAGTNKARIQGPATLAASYTLSLPPDDGNSGEFLQTDGSGALTWAAGGGSGATTALDNLTNVAINADLIFDTGADATIKTKNDSADTKALILQTGTPSAVDINSGSLSATTADVTGTGNSGGLILGTGATENGISGNVIIGTGTVTGGTRGKLQIFDGSEGTAGNFWVSSDTSGSGHWVDGSNLGWDNTNKSFLVGAADTSEVSFGTRIQAIHTATDSGNATALQTVMNEHVTADTSAAYFGIYSIVKPVIDTGKAENGGLASFSSSIIRSDSLDLGSAAFVAGYNSYFEQNNGAKTTASYFGYLTGFHNIDSDGTVTDMYDFAAMPSTVAGGAVTNRYGIYIAPDSGYTKKNWLSGVAQIGGSSLSLDADASLELSETDKALLLNRIDDTAEGGIATNGMLAYNTDHNKFRCYENGAWADCIGAGGGSAGYTGDVTPVTGTYTALNTDDLVVASSGSFTVTLPPSTNKKHFTLKNTDGSSVLTVAADGGELIDGLSTIILPKQGDFIEIVGDGTGWHITANKISASFHFQGGNGHGSTLTHIRLFSNVVENTGNIWTVVNDAANGASVTVNLAGVYSFCLSDGFTADSVIGFSINSSNPTGLLTAQTSSEVPALSGTTAFTHDNVCWTGPLKAGDVLRPHDQGDTDGPVPDRTHFTGARVN